MSGLGEKERQELYEKSKLHTQTIKIAASNPVLKNKIRANLDEESDTVAWYIKFNLALDAASVSKKSMNVTERNGYIIRTDISYDDDNRMIAINPIDCYAQNEYYLLNISKKVRSKKGTRLKREINVMFKLVGNQIEDFKVLPQSTVLPKPKKRPRNYVPKGDVIFPKGSEPKPHVAKVYTFGNDKIENLKKDSLPYDIVRINPIIAILGLAVLIAGQLLANVNLIIGALAITALGLAHLIFQFARKRFRSIMMYNIGVMLFNRGHYQKAKKRFLKAASLDENNEYAEYASGKVEFYL